MTPSPQAKPQVSVIIPCRNERDHIEARVASILSQEPEGGFEVIIADGMSDDGTREALEAWTQGLRDSGTQGLRDSGTQGPSSVPRSTAQSD
jgi:glycosyltransferase involved in cell wall biosynthesis